MDILVLESSYCFIWVWFYFLKHGRKNTQFVTMWNVSGGCKWRSFYDYKCFFLLFRYCNIALLFMTYAWFCQNFNEFNHGLIWVIIWSIKNFFLRQIYLKCNFICNFFLIFHKLIGLYVYLFINKTK
jgi:hypothetical protein